MIVINETEVLAPPPTPAEAREKPPERQPPIGLTPQDLRRALRREALRRTRLRA